MTLKSLLTVTLLILMACLSACDAPTPTADVGEESAMAAHHQTLHSQLISNSKVTLFGEMHGNANSPRVVGAFAKQMLDAHGAVTVALEIPAMDQLRVQNYLQSQGTTGDRCLLLASSFWSPGFADGRSSEAKLKLIDDLRALVHDGHDVEILAFDRRSSPDQQAGEKEMAQAIIDYAQSHPQRRVVALTGNMHARRTSFEVMGSQIQPMSHFIADAVAATTTIKIDYQGGTTIARTEGGLGELQLAPSPRAHEGLYEYEEDDNAFNYYWVVGEAEPSPSAYLSVNCSE